MMLLDTSFTPMQDNTVHDPTWFNPHLVFTMDVPQVLTESVMLALRMHLHASMRHELCLSNSFSYCIYRVCLPMTTFKLIGFSN